MGLLFDADNEYVDHGSDTSLDNLVSFAIAAWIYPTTIDTLYRAVICKRAAVGRAWEFQVIDSWDSSTPNTVQINRTRDGAGSNQTATGSDNLLTLNAWNFVATYCPTWTTAAPSIYNGTLTSIVGDVTEQLTNPGSGTKGDDSSGNLYIGARDGVTTNGFRGGIGFVGVWSGQVALAQLKIVQFKPMAALQVGDCRLLCFPGLHGATTVPDLSGNSNNGTITNATVSIHIPIGLHFGFDASVMPGPLGGTQSMAGAVAAVSLVDGALSLTWSFAGAVAAISSADGTLSVTWSLAGTPAGVSSVSGSLSVTGEVTLVGAVDAAAALCGILSLHRPGPWFSGLLETEKTWLAGALFGGVGANAFKLGTVLSLGWFWVRRSGCLVLYRGPSMRQIDFANVLTVEAQDAGLISPPVYIPHDGGSIYFYVVRRFNNCGYQEHTLAAAVKLVFDAQGDIAEPTPNGIFASRAEQIDADRVWLIWHYCPLEQKSAPACFNVYCDSGTGQIDYDNPIATLGYEGRKFYNYESSALGADRYLFAIRAEDAAGIQNHSLAQMGIQLSTTSPDPISILDVGGV